MPYQCISAVLLALLTAIALPARADVPILLAVDADIGDIYVDRMHLKVGILGVYGAKGLRPKVQISLKETLACSNPDEPCGAFKSVSRTYDQIDDLIAALVEAENHLRRRVFYRSEINLVEVPCEPNNNFQGTVVVDPASMRVQLALKSSNSINLDSAQAAGLLAQLNQARGILAYLKPKFDAFNAAAPDDSIDVILDKSAYIQPLEEFVE